MRPLPALAALAALAACNAGIAEAEAGTSGSTAGAPAEAPASQTSARSVPAGPPVAVPTRFDYTGELTQGGWIRGQAPAGARSAMLGDTALELDANGKFFAAFDRDAPGNLKLVATLPDGDQIGTSVAVSPRAWDIERVDVAKRDGGTSEAWWAKREPEWNAIVGARAQQTGASGWTQDFVWPVTGRVSGRFGRQRIYRGEPGSYHSGIDIAPGNGVPFVAPADGVVVLARAGFSLEGNLIIIDHGAGLNSAFLHASRIVVEEGQNVSQGQHIGDVGASGRATGPHLHWSLKWHDARLDPLLFTGPMD